MADPNAMAQLAQLLSQTVGGNTQAMAAATQQLRAAEEKPGFGLMLLELLRNQGIDAAARQACGIYFKNYIRRQWSVEGTVGGIAASDRQAIKQHILGLMLEAPKAVQVQLAAGLEEISVTDYPAEWQALLPELVNHLKTSSDLNVLKGTMETANTVFKKFGSQKRSDALLKEVKYTVDGFQETHLNVFKAACQKACGQLPADQMGVTFELLNATIGCYHSFLVVDLVEYYEDHQEEWFQGFLEILKLQHESVAGKGDQQGLLEQVKGLICESMALYTDKYQTEFQKYLLPCVTAVWTLLVALTPEEKNDQLVAKGIRFLSSAASTLWEQSPFQDPQVLAQICEKVVFPNIVLRDSDVELFEDNPLEYVRRDMEGADQESRRRSAMDLVKALSKFNEAKVTEILIGYVQNLMGKAQQSTANQAERFKDACIYICIAMAVRGQTQKEGVVEVNPNVQIIDFFTNLVVPALTAQPLAQNSLLRASGLKFVTVFRNQIPREQMGNLLQAVCGHITSESAVVHTYSAICVEKLITVKERNPQGQVAGPRYDAATMKPLLIGMAQPILQIIAAAKGIPQNEYLMRSLARIYSFLKQHGAESGLQLLTPLNAILVAHAANPSNPVFNHNLFEAIASIVKVTVSSQPDAVEAALLPGFGRILEQNVTDFLPYTFQILGLLLDATSSVKPLYQELFARLLARELWTAQANVPGLVRLFRAYFAKHAIFGELLKANMQGILERFQFVLNNKKTEAAAFELLIAMYMHLPIEFYQQHFKMLLTVVLTRLQQTKNPRFQKDFVVTSSLFLHRQQGNILPVVLNELQPGMLVNLLNSLWFQVCKMSLKLDERKVCAVGVCRLMSLGEVTSNPTVLQGCCVSLVSLLGLTQSTTVKVVEEGSDDEVPLVNGGAGQDFEVSFNKLRNTDLPGAAAGLAPDIPDLVNAVKTLLLPHRQVIIQVAQSCADAQPLAVFVQ